MARHPCRGLVAYQFDHSASVRLLSLSTMSAGRAGTESPAPRRRRTPPPVARPRVGRQPPQETTTMVVSDGTPVPSAQAAADASRAQRPRSRFSPREAGPPGRPLGPGPPGDLQPAPGGGLHRTGGDSYDADTVRAAPTAASAGHGMRNHPGEPPPRTAVSRMSERGVSAEEVVAVQVDATGPAQYPGGAEQVADAVDGDEAASRPRRREQRSRRCSPLRPAMDRRVERLPAVSRSDRSSCRRPSPTATPYASSCRSSDR